MNTLKWIFRLRIVFEVPEHPSIRVVTTATVFSKAAFVLIFVSMASETSPLCGTVFRGQVTGLTGCDAMHPDQGEPSQVMVEKDLLVPCLFVVATGTVFSLLSIVHVVDPMTVDTLGLFERIHRAAAMTGGTHQIDVPSLEWEFRILGVIEIDLFPAFRRVALLTFGSISSLVFIILAMAGNTGLIRFHPVRILDMAGLALHLLVTSG